MKLVEVGDTDTWINPEAITAVWPFQTAREGTPHRAITAISFVGASEPLRIHGASVRDVLEAVAR